ncbi:MAG: hydantoinase/oxoprolinase family protein [Candidatus Tectomicrobia bacterium]|nr:hydantoinase/oxoprolinase family protein [Candidatus Tectomicrobia bacterium]
MKFRLGIDVGGTFTDFVLMDGEGALWPFKVPTTPADPSQGLLEGLRAIAAARRVELRDFLRAVEVIVHGTTVTTNALLTGQGARTGLLTTKNFRDALEMRRGIREERYNNRYRPPDPLVPRDLRLPVEERLDHTGAALTALRDDDVRAACAAFRDEGVRAVAVCFLHAYANGAHEQRAAELVREHLPDAYVTVSSELLPQPRFYDRISTTVVNSYVGPVLRRYLRSLTASLADAGFTGHLLVMASNGGVLTPEVAQRMAATSLLSGPAAGPLAGARFAAHHQHADCITVDMGGTSFDAALVKDGAPLTVRDARLNRHLVALPMLGIHTIGAGGGSIGWIDAGGFLRMGPQSAGADPGPACYGRGGDLPTDTDACLVLGYLNPDYFLGGELRLDVEAARRAIRRRIAEPLGLGVEAAAAGMFRIICVNMAAGIREVTVERGLDPRDFPLVVAGGAGPVHAAAIARELDIPRLIVPKESSLFCAYGMLLSDFKHDFVNAAYGRLAELAPTVFPRVFRDLEERGARLLVQEGIAAEAVELRHAIDLRYEGQIDEVEVQITRREVETADVTSITRKFHERHDQLYGYALEGETVWMLNARLTCIGHTSKPPQKPAEPSGEPIEALRKGWRRVALPGDGEFRKVPVYDGDRMGAGHSLRGPALVEQVTTTLLLPPGFNLHCDPYGSYVLTAAREGSP